MASAHLQPPSQPPPNGHTNGQGLVMQSPSYPARARQHAAPLLIRPTLPSRHVDAATFEDAFVSFIMYCNPAVPLETDTGTLREAFRALPKSGGKSFTAFNLFLLVRQLETKELKTWAELALKLGVDPPDKDKGESSQKIQQYAVRLKRWMHSMHVDAFFEYLMSIPHPYWTDIPTDPTPIYQEGRDGVAPVDDMALRALVPQARPKRGKKRPEEESLNESPSQRPRIEPPASEEYGTARNSLGPWSAHPDARGRFTARPPDSLLRPGPGTGPWLHEPDAQTPLTAYPLGPLSAITPTTRNNFWGDSNEPMSAVNPKGKTHQQRRHGAKVVSSAWRSRGLGGNANGKARGRPPMNRNIMDKSAQPAGSAAEPGYDSSVPDGSDQTITPAMHTPPSNTSLAGTPIGAPSIPTPIPPTAPLPSEFPVHTQRPTKPSISLQVPERVGGSVRLATPPRPYFPPPNLQLPPEVVVHGQPNPDHGGFMNQTFSSTAAPTNVARAAAATTNPRPTAQQYTSNPAFNFETTDHEVPSLDPAPRVTPLGFFDDMEERTNIDATFGYFHSEVLRADWYDASGKRTPPCSLDEAHALVASIIEALYAAAASHAAFLINVAALAGGAMLMTTDKMQIRRLVEYEDRTHFECSWVYRLGSVKGTYRMAQTVQHERWQRSPDVSEAEDDPGTTKGGGGLWRNKYENLMKEMRAKDKELAAMKRKVLGMLDS
ncbi:ARS-binding protein [Verticillium dahliae VdLs.17]|uniref:ARS-binding protein n=3 Tax=Verticillium dahliae TaxID=27337 RepID=G2X9Z8_VERDV|nr:ARS-binding protein [Verticillium dahliae VdLs.17]EGY15737.1 ARS-binding protein [Verticillium dahliae VdLs.17]KAF3343654.1 putative membrane protein C3B8.06 [Verticillium dahliae VDG2]KAH6702382.1 ARS-binding protein [Verticillium dahliae]RXG50589.1 hypothetical protein VDGE_06901 [Verticillium dahliae]